MAVDDDEKAAANASVEDRYSKPIPSMDDRAAQGEDKRDSATIQRESFLNIYKEG